jgi:hypothetical protein
MTSRVLEGPRCRTPDLYERPLPGAPRRSRRKGGVSMTSGHCPPPRGWRTACHASRPAARRADGRLGRGRVEFAAPATEWLSGEDRAVAPGVLALLANAALGGTTAVKLDRRRSQVGIVEHILPGARSGPIENCLLDRAPESARDPASRPQPATARSTKWATCAVLALRLRPLHRVIAMDRAAPHGPDRKP